MGEWATSSVWIGEGNRLTAQWEIDFLHSLGLLYSAFTYFTGFKMNSGEYKLMGLVPYGEPKYLHVILENPCWISRMMAPSGSTWITSTMPLGLP